MSGRRLLFLDMDGVIVDFSYASGARWGEIGFWESLKKTTWADELVKMCRKWFDVHILSSLGGGPQSATGKMLWLDRYYPSLVEGTILTRKKYLLAAPGRILVDDDPRNIDQWFLSGGYGIRVPNADREAEWGKLEGGIEGVFTCLTNVVAALSS